MILLEPGNKIIAETLQMRFEGLNAGEKPEGLEMQLADFDGVLFHLSTPDADNRHNLRISMSIKCYRAELVKYGADVLLKREYGDWLQASPESGYDVTLLIAEDQVPPAERESLIKKVSLLKTNAMSAPFERAFQEQLSGAKSSVMMPIHYRDEEAIYVKAAHDRVTVIFSVLFRDDTDKILAKVFLQEFVDCRRQPGLQNAPQALYTNKEPPMELRGQANVREGENYGFVTFVLFPRHYEKETQRVNTIQLIQYFRDYLHYHIKCSKAYMHSRMRAKVDSWMKVLNRAKPEAEKEKKTASGKTFVRK